MSITRIDTIVIGLGLIGKEHARAVAENPLTKLVGVIDLDEELARDVGETHSVDIIETDHSEAIARADPELVVIATPEEHHVAPTECALEAGCHVLLEKPIAATESDARRIGELVDAAETSLMVGYLCRFDPRYARLKNELNEFGELLSIHAARISSNWGYYRRGDQSRPEYYLSVHDIDMLRWYVDSEIKVVEAKTTRGLDDIETPAVIHALLEFEDGTIGNLETNWARPQTHPSALTQTIRVTGTNGYSEASFEFSGGDLPISTENEFYYGDQIALHGERQGPLRRELEHFVSCINADREPMITWKDGLESLRVANAMIESGERDQPVSL